MVQQEKLIRLYHTLKTTTLLEITFISKVQNRTSVYFDLRNLTIINYVVIKYSYEGPLVDENVFQKALESGPSSVDYTKLIEWVTTELGAFHNIDYQVNAVSGE